MTAYFASKIRGLRWMMRSATENRRQEKVVFSAVELYGYMDISQLISLVLWDVYDFCRDNKGREDQSWTKVAEELAGWDWSLT